MTDAQTYTITFPMVIGLLGIILGGVLVFFVKKWIADSEREAEKKEISTDDAFKLVRMRMDVLTEKHERDVEKIHQLELMIAGLVKREELTELYAHIDKFKDEIIKALAGGGK